MPDRFHFSSHRYGFNGKERDNEWQGDGNIYDYGFRIYNPRLAKFLSVDPLSSEFPWYTPYQFAGNKPIWKIDLDGLEEANSEANEEFDFSMEIQNDTKNSIPRTDAVDSHIPTSPGTIASVSDGSMVKKTAQGWEEARYIKNWTLSGQARTTLKRAEGLGPNNINDANGNCETVCPYYDDSGDVPTVGWGHVITHQPHGLDMNNANHTNLDGITLQQAENLLNADIQNEIRPLLKQIKVPITQNEYNALVLAKYNGGYGQTLARTVNSLDTRPLVIQRAFLLRVYDNGQMINGLIARRALEASIFLHGNYRPYPSSEFPTTRAWYNYWKEVRGTFNY